MNNAKDPLRRPLDGSRQRKGFQRCDVDREHRDGNRDKRLDACCAIGIGMIERWPLGVAGRVCMSGEMDVDGVRRVMGRLLLVRVDVDERARHGRGVHRDHEHR